MCSEGSGARHWRNKPDPPPRTSESEIMTIPRTGAKRSMVRVRRLAMATCIGTICIAVALCSSKDVARQASWTRAPGLSGRSCPKHGFIVYELVAVQVEQLIAGNGRRFRDVSTRILGSDGKSWKTVSSVDPQWNPMDADARSNRFVKSRATLLSDGLDVRFTIGLLSPDGQFTTRTTTPLHLDQAKLFSG